MTIEQASKPKQSWTWRYRLTRLLVWCALCYLGVCILLVAFENRLVYPATKASQEWWPKPSPEVEDVQLTTKNGVNIHAWWWKHPKAKGAVLYLHGNGGNLAHRGQPIEVLRATTDESVFIVDYPGYGKSDGSPTEQGCYESAHAAYQWLVDNQQIPPENIVLFGESLGGAVAVELAMHHPCRAVVLLKTFTSLPDVAKRLYPFLPIRWMMRNRFPTLDRIGQCQQPVFIAHGTIDGLVPYDQATKLYDAANEPKEFYPMNDLGHNDGVPADFFDRVHAFVEKHAPRDAEPAAEPTES